jgi:predicted RNA binding protein YcfA (HicA-like mRNA interferase family)
LSTRRNSPASTPKATRSRRRLRAPVKPWSSTWRGCARTVGRSRWDRSAHAAAAGVSERLPVVSGQELIGALEKVGWVAVRQRGSHVRLKHDEPSLIAAASGSSRAVSRAGRPATQVRVKPLSRVSLVEWRQQLDVPLGGLEGAVAHVLHQRSQRVAGLPPPLPHELTHEDRPKRLGDRRRAPRSGLALGFADDERRKPSSSTSDQSSRLISARRKPA